MKETSNSIPDFDERGNLPPGVYQVAYSELERRFCKPHSMVRKKLMDCLKQMLLMYKEHAKEIYIDGSFVSEKLGPNDIDIIIVWKESYQAQFDIDNFELFQNGMKGKLQIRTRFEHMPFPSTNYLEFFQHTKPEDDVNNISYPKGIILLENES